MDTARAFLANSPPPAEALALLLGTAQLSIFGLAGLANPDSFAEGYGLPLVSTPTTSGSKVISPKDNQRALITAISARNITNGVLILGLGCWLRDRRALGLAVACNVFTTVADVVIVRGFGVEGHAGHWVGVVNNVVLGTVLLGWGRTDSLW